MKATFLVIGTVIKALIALAGMGITIYFLIKGFSNNDESAKKKALKYFLLTVGAVVFLSGIEFLIAYLW